MSLRQFGIKNISGCVKNTENTIAEEVLCPRSYLQLTDDDDREKYEWIITFKSSLDTTSDKLLQLSLRGEKVSEGGDFSMYSTLLNEFNFEMMVRILGFLQRFRDSFEDCENVFLPTNPCTMKLQCQNGR